MTTTTLLNQQTLAAKTEFTEQGIWDEQMTQDGVRVVLFRRPMPIQLVQQYAAAAARRASLRQLEDGTWFAEIVGFDGVWAQEASQKDALDVLEEVVFEWAVLKIRDEDRDLPVLESLDLNAL